MKTESVSFAALLLAVLFLCNLAHATETIDISDPWIREAPPAARVLAGYMLIRNNTASAITINGISSLGFESAELHRTVIREGIARMLPVKQLDIPANGSVRLEPGGLHLMLFNPGHALRAGDHVTLTIHLDNGSRMNISAPVVRQNGETRSPHNH